MSLIDLEKNKAVGSEGIKRTLDENSISLILDTISIDQYMLPEQSIVRELTANAIDSQKEKDQAISILTGIAKVEDYYIQRDDPKYKDSNFNVDYYNIKCLNTDKNKVELTYIEGKDGVGWCDTFTVKDYGVGLGDDRLYGYLNAGYSTKRNNLYTLGSFGFGAKVGLSLRNDYYVTTTVHNNRKFKLQCYSYKVDSVIGKFTSDGKENEFITFKDGSKVYFEHTDEKNYTEVSLPCKTHHKSKFYNAVKAQLLYFDNVDFKVIDKIGRVEDVDFQADVLYNSEHLIIADQYQYSRPHIVVVKDKKTSVGTCYGYANFKEMEMQELYSPVGFKCPIRQVVRNADGSVTEITPGIEVTSSRENVIWSDTTRAYVKGIIDKAKDEASALVEKQLDEKDFLQWIYKANNILNRTGSNKALDALSRIVDTSDLSPAFPGDKTIKYCNPKLMFWGMSVRYNEKLHNYKEKKDEISRKEIESWGHFPINRIYIQKDNTQTTRDFYLCHTSGNFITIRVDSNEELFKHVKETPTTDAEKKWTKEYVQKLIDKRDRILKYLEQSSVINNYDTIEVPEEWSKKFEAQIKDAEEVEKVAKLSPAELRKLEEKTIVSTIYPEKWKNDKRLFAWEKHEPKISELKDDEADVFYGNQEDEETIDFIGLIMARQFEQYKPIKDRHSKYYNDTIKIVRVSKSMPKKYLTKHSYVSEFFKTTIIDKEVGMSTYLVKWNTARLIHDKLKDIRFFENYKNFNNELYDFYQEVKSYSQLNYAPVNELLGKYTNGVAMMNSVIQYSSKVNELQLFIREHKDDAEAIRQKSTELFGINTIENALGLDLEMYDKLQTLLEYSEPVKALFNHLECLTKPTTIDFDTETLIKEIIHNKGLHEFKIESKELIENEVLS